MTLSAVSWPQQAGAQGDALERIKARGSIILGHRETSIPLSYVADGKPVGYALDLCQKLAGAIAQHLAMRQLKIEYRPVSSSTRFEAIERGEIDLECGSTTNTASRRARVAFTIPHFVASSRLIVRSSTSYDQIEDLHQKTVASTAGSTNVKALERAAQLKSTELNVALAKDHAEGVHWVLTGKVEAFAMDDVLLYGLRASVPRPADLKIVGKSMSVEPYAIGFERENPVLKKIIDTEMRRLILSGELHRTYDKWFLNPIPPKGINLGMRMPSLLLTSLKFPTDYVPD